MPDWVVEELSGRFAKLRVDVDIRVCNGTLLSREQYLNDLQHKGYEDAAFSREELPPSKRPRHYLIVDEFAEFSANTERSLSRTLSETRKYGLFCGTAIWR